MIFSGKFSHFVAIKHFGKNIYCKFGKNCYILFEKIHQTLETPKQMKRKERKTKKKEPFFKRKETLTPIHPATYVHICRALRLRDKIDGAQWTRMEVDSSGRMSEPDGMIGGGGGEEGISEN
jgi:hypothetical protein